MSAAPSAKLAAPHRMGATPTNQTAAAVFRGQRKVSAAPLCRDIMARVPEYGVVLKFAGNGCVCRGGQNLLIVLKKNRKQGYFQ